MPIGSTLLSAMKPERSLDRGDQAMRAGANAVPIVAMDDDPMTLRLLQAHLAKAGYEIETALAAVGGLESIDDSTAVALVDLRMPDLSGFDVLRHIQKYYPTVQVIVLTASDDVADAVDAMREGAFQFLTKPFDPSELLVYVEKAVQAWRVADENRDLKESHSHNFPVRIVEAPGEQHDQLIRQIDRIASIDSTVFIGGESGTGKSTIARMIHQKSRRAGGPFVTVNCASLPRDLIQSELFGHTKGSFTGAVKDRIGHAEVAHHGTLFLDEIGDLPLELQPKLLTFLQDRIVQRLGSANAKQVDVRLIAASHRDLAEMCRSGLFRQDLFFRLMVLNLELPALRNRFGEFDLIVDGILTRICERQLVGKRSLDVEAATKLRAHRWPGNIRELENVLERAVAFSEESTIGAQDIQFNRIAFEPDRISQTLETLSGVEARNPAAQDAKAKDSAAECYSLVGKTLQEIERDAIVQTLQQLGGNKAQTARMLGISEKSVYNKMRRLDIST